MRFLFALIFLCGDLYAGVWVRINMAGYTPERTKTAVVLSDTDIGGQSWRLKAGGKTVLEGRLAAARRGDDYFVAQKFYYSIDFSSVKAKGVYALELAGARTERVVVSDDPFSLFATQAVAHLRSMRSRHRDGAAIVFVGKGAPQAGAWQEASPRRVVNMYGGHYDAGDYIKFTLNEAYLAWHLLTAYQENPSLFVETLKPASHPPYLPDILDEAVHSLNYLRRAFPDENTFIIQVGDARDHDQGWRMPEADLLDGKRPALSALSRAHMGAAAAALALGAQVFRSEPVAFTMKAAGELALRCEEQARAIYARARMSDTQAFAFERGETNDFYFDDSDRDNMALAAAELFRLTREQHYLDDARAYAPEAGSWVSWAEWNFFANHLLAKLGDVPARSRALVEAGRYEQENPWGAPNDYTWGTLHRWIGMANAHFRAQRDLNGVAAHTAPFLGVLDYVFGRNNWGLAMLASPDLPNSVRNIYNGIYRLSGAFPLGALSEGPGDKATHDRMRRFFGAQEYSPLEEFNTAAAVFYDNADDFMIQEATIGGQGDLLLMLALASAKNLSPKATLGAAAEAKPKAAPVAHNPKSASRAPAALFVNRSDSLLTITPSPTCKADSLSVSNRDGKSITILYRNAENRYIWNTRHIPAGMYNIHPSDGSPALTLTINNR